MTDEKKSAAVSGNEAVQYEWMIEEVNEFYEAVNNRDEAIGLIRTFQQFNNGRVKKLWKKVKKDITDAFTTREMFNGMLKN